MGAGLFDDDSVPMVVLVPILEEISQIGPLGDRVLIEDVKFDEDDSSSILEPLLGSSDEDHVARDELSDEKGL